MSRSIFLKTNWHFNKRRANVNKFSGTIPTQLGLLFRLTELYFICLICLFCFSRCLVNCFCCFVKRWTHANFLGGTIPTELGHLQQINSLWVIHVCIPPFGNVLLSTIDHFPAMNCEEACRANYANWSNWQYCYWMTTFWLVHCQVNLFCCECWRDCECFGLLVLMWVVTF